MISSPAVAGGCGIEGIWRKYGLVADERQDHM